MLFVITLSSQIDTLSFKWSLNNTSFHDCRLACVNEYKNWYFLDHRSLDAHAYLKQLYSGSNSIVFNTLSIPHVNDLNGSCLVLFLNIKLHFFKKGKERYSLYLYKKLSRKPYQPKVNGIFTSNRNQHYYIIIGQSYTYCGPRKVICP